MMLMSFRRPAFIVRRTAFLVTTALTVTFGCPAAHAEPISRFYVFGDSSSDVGSEGFARRPTNLGPSWSEAFGSRIGQTSTPAFARTLDAGSTLIDQRLIGGNNHAVNGATAVPYPGLSSFGEQIDAFAAAQGRFGRSDLVFTWFTRNDITTGFFGAGYDRKAYVETYVAQIARLRGLGARNLVAVGAEVHLLPERLLLDAGVPTALIETLKIETNASEAALWPRLAASGVYVLDLNRLAEDVRSNPRKYGFVSTTDGYQGRGLNDGVPSQLRPGDGNVFTEDGHYTSAMQTVVSDFFFAQLRARDQFRTILLQSGQAFRRDAQAMSDVVRAGFADRASTGSRRVSGPWRVYGTISGVADTQPSAGGTDVRLGTANATFAAGIDHATDGSWLVGARAALTGSRGTFAENAGQTSREAALFSTYAAGRVLPDLRVHAAAHYGIADFGKIERRAALGPALERAEGRTSGDHVAAEIGAAYSRRIVGGWVAEVRGTSAYERTGLAAYREAPSVLSLAYGSSAYSSVLGTVGLRIERDAPDGVIRPFVDVVYTRDLLSSDIRVDVGPTNETVVPYLSDRGYRNALSFKGGASYTVQHNLSVAGSIQYTRMEDGRKFDSFGGTISFRISF